jgi:uncharacterized protein involved in tolerance to divalent cations
MVNIIIYLENEMRTKATQLVHDLLKNEFVASASIDEDNSYFIQKKGKIEKTTHTLITAQTKSLMFTEIVEYIENNVGSDVPVFSVPLTQMNEQFNEYIKSRTKKI